MHGGELDPMMILYGMILESVLMRVLSDGGQKVTRLGKDITKCLGRQKDSARMAAKRDCSPVRDQRIGRYVCGCAKDKTSL